MTIRGRLNCYDRITIKKERLRRVVCYSWEGVQEIGLFKHWISYYNTLTGWTLNDCVVSNKLDSLKIRLCLQ